MKYDAATFLESLFRPTAESMAPDHEIRVEDLDMDWRVEWEERAAVMEFDGALPRERAEGRALAEIVKAMKQSNVAQDDDA